MGGQYRSRARSKTEITSYISGTPHLITISDPVDETSLDTLIPLIGQCPDPNLRFQLASRLSPHLPVVARPKLWSQITFQPHLDDPHLTSPRSETVLGWTDGLMLKHLVLETPVRPTSILRPFGSTSIPGSGPVRFRIYTRSTPSETLDSYYFRGSASQLLDTDLKSHHHARWGLDLKTFTDLIHPRKIVSDPAITNLYAILPKMWWLDFTPELWAALFRRYHITPESITEFMIGLKKLYPEGGKGQLLQVLGPGVWTDRLHASLQHLDETYLEVTGTLADSVITLNQPISVTGKIYILVLETPIPLR